MKLLIAVDSAISTEVLVGAVGRARPQGFGPLDAGQRLRSARDERQLLGGGRARSRAPFDESCEGAGKKWRLRIAPFSRLGLRAWRPSLRRSPRRGS